MSALTANFDVTTEKEITLKGFLALHEMTASDEGGEEELWQVVKALGYNGQLQLHQVTSLAKLFPRNSHALKIAQMLLL